MFPRFSK